MALDASIILAGNPGPQIDVAQAQQRALQTHGMQQQAQERIAKAKEAADAKKADEAIRTLLKDSLIQDQETGVWTYDREKILPLLGVLPPEVRASLDDADKHVGEISKGQKAALAKIASLVDITGNSPVVFEAEAARAVKNGLITEAQVQPYLDAIKADPTKVAAITGALTGKAPAKPGEGEFTLSSPGAPDARFRAGESKPYATGLPPTPKPDEPVFQVSPDRGAVKQIGAVPAGAHIVNAPRPPAASGGGQATSPKDAAMVAAILKNPRLYESLTPSAKQAIIPALSAAGFDFEKAMIGDAKGGPNVGAIITKIEELSKVINTSAGGLGSVVSGMKRGAAAAMQMDNDAAQYESLVSGMIPMVARAVGHTGVLTQQDVDSVRAMFPTLKDNAELAQKKLATVQSLLTGKSDKKDDGPADLVYDPVTKTFKKAGGG